jgi:hypothetical protein
MTGLMQPQAEQEAKIQLLEQFLLELRIHDDPFPRSTA